MTGTQSRRNVVANLGLYTITCWASVVLSVLAFVPSYVMYWRKKRWLFAGIVGVSPLQPVEPDEYRFLSVHVVATALWMGCCAYQLWTRGTDAHKTVGYAAVVCALLMVSVVPSSEQMSSCFPSSYCYFGLLAPAGSDVCSRDVSAVVGNILSMLLHVGLGIAAVRLKYPGYRAVHKQFMLLGVLSSLGPAAMRIPIAWAAAVRAVQQRGSPYSNPVNTTVPAPGPDGLLRTPSHLTLGQWLLAKEVAYLFSACLAGAPMLVPGWSPYWAKVRQLARFLWNRECPPLKALLLCVGAFLLWGFALYGFVGIVWRALWYTSVIGTKEGACLIFHQPKLYY